MREWSVDVALPTEWSVGVIVGPSMAGKTTLAHEPFPGSFSNGAPDLARVADAFLEVMRFDEMTSCEFARPPSASWMFLAACLIRSIQRKGGAHGPR